MAKITYFTALEDYQWIPDLLQPNDPARITLGTETRLSWTNPDGTKVTLAGTGFAFDSGEPIAGTVTGVAVRSSTGSTLFTVSGASADLQKLYSFAFGFDREDGNNRHDANGFDFLSYLTRGNDIINGSSGSDDVIGGRNRGNDVIDARGGDDFVKGDAGSDKINGGSGYDTLSYQESFYDESAYKGVNVNMVTGIALDCWGGQDTFKNFEEARGSFFRDTLIGNAQDNSFMGLRGNDAINGGGGLDYVLYADDHRFGGQRGIVANLATGKIKDGFGSLDTVKNIEGITATKFADKLLGSGLDNEFESGGGNDIINGGGGFDYLSLRFWENATQGAEIDMTRATGQIVNDSFGSTDTISSIEMISGSDLSDQFTGDGARNRFRGDRGDDIMNGGGGDDFIRGDAGRDTLTGGGGSDEFKYEKRRGEDPWGDTITDFESGTDKITFNTLDFSGMGTVKKFNVGTAASGAGSWFYFNPADHTFYWDRDGTGSSSAIAVATLTGVNTMTINDFELFN